MVNQTPARRCTECGTAQQLVRRTTDYPESGLDNVQLVNVPIWECSDGHQELQIPAVEQLHAQLLELVLKKPVRLTGREVRFLRKELGMSAKAFAEQLGMTAVHLSRVEHEARRMTAVMSSHVRLAVAWELAKRKRIPVDHLEPFVAAMQALDIEGSHRLKHLDNAPPDQQWTQDVL